MMSRSFAIVALLLALTAGSAGVRAAAQTPDVVFTVHGATEVEVTTLGGGERQISYHAPSSWFVDVVSQLERDGWESAHPAAYAPLSRSYLRARKLGVCDMLEWVFVSFDPGNPRNAQIRVRRAVVFPWWRRLSRLSQLLIGDVPRQLDTLRGFAPEPSRQLGQAPDTEHSLHPVR
jgi:hypothetical protein